MTRAIGSIWLAALACTLAACSPSSACDAGCECFSPNQCPSGCTVVSNTTSTGTYLACTNGVGGPSDAGDASQE